MLDSKDIQDLKVQVENTNELKNKSISSRVSHTEVLDHRSDARNIKRKYESAFPIPENKTCNENLKKLVSHQTQQNSSAAIPIGEHKETRINLRNVQSAERKVNRYL